MSESYPRVHTIEDLHAEIGLPYPDGPAYPHARRLRVWLDEGTFQTWRSRHWARRLDPPENTNISAHATSEPWQRIEFVRGQIGHTEEVIRFADAKAGLLLGILAAAVGWLASNFLTVLFTVPKVPWTKTLIVASGLVCLVAAGMAANVVRPRVGLLDKKRRGLFWPQHVARWNQRPDHLMKGYWAERRSGVAQQVDGTGDYLNLMRYASPDLLLDELCEHAVIQSRICARKYTCLKRAFAWGAGAAVVVLLMLCLAVKNRVYSNATPVVLHAECEPLEQQNRRQDSQPPETPGGPGRRGWVPIELSNSPR